MKKLLTILGAIGLTATSASIVVSCNTQEHTDGYELPKKKFGELNLKELKSISTNLYLVRKEWNKKYENVEDWSKVVIDNNELNNLILAEFKLTGIMPYFLAQKVKDDEIQLVEGDEDSVIFLKDLQGQDAKEQFKEIWTQVNNKDSIKFILEESLDNYKQNNNSPLEVKQETIVNAKEWINWAVKSL